MSEVAELLRNGVIVLDKPMGPTSHQVTAWVKGILGIDKAGHGGTLDPRATGVLIVMLGPAARGAMALLYGEKEYLGVVRFHADVDESTVRDIASEFVGPIYQTPPLKSAVKRKLRVRKIYEIEVLDLLGRDVLMRVRCESGTYIRTLAKDMGRGIGTGAHLQELRRIRSGPFSIQDAVTLQELTDAYYFWKEEGDDELLSEVIRPFRSLFNHLPRIVVKDSAVDALCRGAPLHAPGVKEVDSMVEKNRPAVVLTEKDEVVGLAMPHVSADVMASLVRGTVATLRRVFMPAGAYPSCWKRGSR